MDFVARERRIAEVPSPVVVFLLLRVVCKRACVQACKRVGVQACKRVGDDDDHDDDDHNDDDT